MRHKETIEELLAWYKESTERNLVLREDPDPMQIGTNLYLLDMDAGGILFHVSVSSLKRDKEAELSQAYPLLLRTIFHYGLSMATHFHSTTKRNTAALQLFHEPPSEKNL